MDDIAGKRVVSRADVDIEICTPVRITALADGSVSLVFNVPQEIAQSAFELHPLLKRGVRLKVYEVT